MSNHIYTTDCFLVEVRDGVCNTVHEIKITLDDQGNPKPQGIGTIHTLEEFYAEDGETDMEGAKARAEVRAIELGYVPPEVE